ncbi:hypothetical protein K3X02_15010, partial [Listeria monocytogenes]|nr:hypothetical protein [Listeria monocytogenes]
MEGRKMGGKETRKERRKSTSANTPTAIHQQGKKCSIITGRIIFREKNKSAKLNTISTLTQSCTPN